MNLTLMNCFMTLQCKKGHFSLFFINQIKSGQDSPLRRLMRNTIPVVFETVPVTFIGFTRNLGLTWLKKTKAGSQLQFIFVPFVFYYNSVVAWVAGRGRGGSPHCLALKAAPNDRSNDWLLSEARPIGSSSDRQAPFLCYSCNTVFSP